MRWGDLDVSHDRKRVAVTDEGRARQYIGVVHIVHEGSMPFLQEGDMYHTFPPYAVVEDVD